MPSSKTAGGQALLLCFILLAVAASPSCQWSFIQLSRAIFGFSHPLASKFSSVEEKIWEGWKTNNATVEATSPLIITSRSDLHEADLTKPFVIRGLASDTVLSIASMISDTALKDIEIDFFEDARLKNTVPDSKGKLGEVVKLIYAG
jgi:hypothetical protein